MSNPIFGSSAAFNPAKQQQQTQQVQEAQLAGATPEQLNEMFNLPSASGAQTGRMTFDDVIVKTISMFAVLLVTAVVGWFIPAVAIPAAIVGLVLGLVNAFRKNISVPMYIAYAAVQGLFLGGISGMFEAMYPGVVIQAVIGTFAVFGIVLALFVSGKLRATPKLTKFFIVALSAYALFSLVNFGMMMFGAIDGMYGMRSIEIFGGIPLGFILGPIAILLASYSLIMDFEFIKYGVESGAPAREGWRAAFGLMVTLIWLYLEILRLLAMFAGRD